MDLEKIKDLVKKKAFKNKSSFRFGFWNEKYEVYVLELLKTFRADSEEELVEKIHNAFIENRKDQELFALAKKHGHSLPRKGIVDLVLENCPTWKEQCVYWDGSPWNKSGIGISVGRRIKKLRIRRK